MAALRRQFVVGLAGRLHALRAAPDDAQRIQVLHKLAGAAGLFGYGALGEEARAAETLHLEGADPAAATQATAVVAQHIERLLAPGPGQDQVSGAGLTES